MGLLEKLLRGAPGGPTSAPPSGLACPHCGATNADSARFCQQCGKPRG